jgi:translocation and assembly module TamB
VSEAAANPQRKRRTYRQAAIGLAILAVFVIAAWYFTSAGFHERMRLRLVSQLETITGGRVEIGRFDWNLSRLEFDVHDLTIHGLEAPDQVPYAHADRLLIHARIVSLFRREIALNGVQIEHPVMHLIVYPDGHTNQPRPKTSGGVANAQDIFELAIKHTEINNGQLIFNEEVIPFALKAGDLQAGMIYVPGANRYDGQLKINVEQLKYSQFMRANTAVDLAFSLHPNEFEITSLHVLAGASKLDATGKLDDFAKPAATFNYKATVDAMELAHALHLREIKRGQFEFTGSGTYSNAQLLSTGKLVVRNLDYRDPAMRLPNIDAAADYRVDNQKLTLTRLVGRVFGGIGKGDLTVTFAAPNPSPKKRGPEQTGVFHLTVDNMPAGMVAAAFSIPELDVTKLNAVGTGRGKIDGHWRGDISRLLVDLDVNVTPPAQFGPDQTPVTGDLKGTLEPSVARLHADSLHIRLPYLQLTASGTLGSMKDKLQIDAAVSDLSRIRPVLTMVHREASSAADVAGQLKFNGDVSGKLFDPAVNGHVQVSDLTFPLAAIWTPPPPLQVVSTSVPRQPRPKFIHLDSGSADVSLSSQGVAVRNGAVRRAGAQAKMDLSVGLTQGNFTDASPITAHVVVRDAALADLQQIAGYDYPISGNVAGDLNVNGTRLNLQGGGHVQVSDAVVYGETVRSAAADVRFLEQEARVTNLLLIHDHAQVNGSGAYNLKTETFHFQVMGSNFELATIPQLNRNRVGVSGQLNFNASGSGTVDAPVVNASARLQNLVVNGQRVGDANLLAVTKGDTLHLTARSNFQQAAVSLDGTIRLRDMMPSNLNVEFSNFDFMPFLQSAVQSKLSGQSYVGGTLKIDGPLKNPDALTVLAQIPRLTAQMEGVELHNAEPIRLSVMNGVVRLDSFQLAGTDTQLTAQGAVDLGGDRRMNVRAQGRLNLKLVQSFNSDLNSGGLVDLNLNVGGTLNKPDVVGELKITNGALSLIDFPNGLSEINGNLIFNEERIQVQSLTARTGGGQIQIGGFATYNPRVAFNITAQGQDIRMRYPQGVSSTADLNLKLAGTLNSSTLSGDVTITRFAFNSQFDLATFMAKNNRPPEAPRASPLNNVHFNIHVTSTPQLQVQSSLAKVAGNADLQVRGTPSNPVVLGRINLTEGQFDFNGANYKLDRGDITFLNPAHTDPIIDIAATTRVRDYDITFRVSGQVSKALKPTFSSDPPLPEADIINLLAFGQTREEAQIASTQGSSTMTESVSNTILGQAFNAAVSNRVQKLFGVSRVKISPEVGGAQTNPTAQVTVEQQVSNKLTVTYITNLTQSSQQSIFVEYNLDRNVSLVAGRDQYGVVSFDIRMRQRKR